VVQKDKIQTRSTAKTKDSSVKDTFATVGELFNLDGREGLALRESLTGCLVREIRIDVADVGLALELWYVRRRQLPSIELVPVYGREEWMSLDLLHL